MKKVIGLLMLLGLFSQQLFAAELKNMKLILDKQGIKIWSYQVANSPYYGFKAVTTVKSSLTGMVALITDTQAADQWLYRTKEVVALSREDDDRNFTVRVVTSFPWPLKDREAVVAGQITQDPNNMLVKIDSHSVANHPVRDGYERMPNVHGGWEFRALGNGQVEVTMTGHAELDLYVPAIIRNILLQEHPYHSLWSLQKIIGEPRFQTARLNSVNEPVFN